MSKNMESTDELLPCPGKRLQAAREAKGMDVAQAAEQLHLSRAMVNALEAEDYAKLPARVFVRGYYKNYARLVEVPVDTILQEFEDRCPDGDCNTAPLVATRSAKPEVRSNHSLVRLITWLVVFTLVAMLVIWWQGYFNWPKTPKVTEQPAAAYEEETTVVPETTPNATEEMVEDVIPAITEPEPEQQAEEADQPAPAAVEVTEEVAADANAETTEDVTEAVETPTAVAPTTVEAPHVEEIEVPVKPELIVLFSGDCWVDIRDSTRQFKLFGRMADGDMRKLGGEPPYTMVFGDYSVAKLLVNGTPYDLSAHAKGNTAKFTFDPSTAVSR